MSDHLMQLRRPFNPDAVQWKIQQTFKTGNGGIVIGYIDSRLASERLNHVVGSDWEDTYQRVEGGHLLLCKLTVAGQTHTDIGEGEGKALFSDAFKRAAVKFGVGVSLYSIPPIQVWEAQGHVKNVGGKLYLQAEGKQHATAAYTAWLDAVGAPLFGTPLDHSVPKKADG